ncbi:cryptochrome/photolyase family protein [Planctobacterium marinum]|uniref:Deoxyribodipyrimidine photo-lyase n=1 Tax=Planctobacterium marinum TaxID=1631968 RepID=A0AA48HQE6_9ALTE|nr:deoxyribodipyrimidine photo-lyase [Planctobacterium marinum]
MVTIYWMRNDLRLTDNPALCFAVEQGSVLPIYIHDTGVEKECGAATRRWLHDSLLSIDSALKGNLRVFKGEPLEVLNKLVADLKPDAIVWNRGYEPETIARDTKIKSGLQEQGLKVKSFNAGHLWAPTDILKKDGTPYKVFTPYYRKGCLAASVPRFPLQRPAKINFVETAVSDAVDIEDLNFIPKINWDEQMMRHWSPGEQGAKDRLQAFLDGPLFNYKEERNIPAVAATSRLSPHLHFGEISPNQVWYAVLDKCEQQGISVEHPDVDCYLSELGWREFSAYLLFHFSDMVTENFNVKFNKFAWRSDNQQLQAWQRGKTGIPIVDAGMRELWATGYMHNRVRMIVGSFLVKNLLLDWREGEAWFWDCLVDADLASNVASWQWVAGSGADAAPYFRIFNPVTQGEKFDPQGEYVKTWCPELKKVPAKLIHKPWEAKTDILRACGVELGNDYPEPLVDLKASRQRALDAFAELKNVS